MIYEERRIVLKRDALPDYLRLSREEVWPRLAQRGGRVLCLLGGLIGDPAEVLLQITRFPDLTAWERCQRRGADPRGQTVEREEVRLLQAVASRPKEIVPAEDRRATYGYRRFLIRPADLEEFVYCSEEGVWPRIEAQGARILGLWCTLAATDPLELILLTGYHGPAHWERTRGDRPMPRGFDRELWERSRRLRSRRQQLTLRSWVSLMRAIEIETT